MDNRPSFDEYYLNMAKVAATRGDCTRSQVGAVLVTPEHIALPGYNGTSEPKQPGCLDGACPRGRMTLEERPSTNDYSDCIAVHAEANTLRKARQLGWTLVMGSTLYVTREPCIGCQIDAGRMRVGRIVWPGGEIVDPRFVNTTANPTRTQV